MRVVSPDQIKLLQTQKLDIVPISRGGPNDGIAQYISQYI